MKKLLIIPFLFAFISCAGNDITDNTANNSNNTSGGNSSGISNIEENKIVIGNNQVSYDTNKTFNTLIYNMQTPATDTYTTTNSYTISASRQNVLSMQKVQTLQKMLVSNNELTSNIDNSLKSKMIEINRDAQNYVFNNNIRPIEKNNNVLNRTIPQTVEIGTKWENAYLLNPYTYTFSTISATCIAVSEKAYFFLQDGLDNLTSEQITAITTAFDKDYNIIHQYYGEETDTDGNGKVSFLIANIPNGIFGFFYSVDKYPQALLPAQYKSNESDVLYVNYNYFTGDNWTKYQTDLKATFIHEFQHMVLFDTRNRLFLNPALNTWINEGLSMLSEYYAGYAGPHYNYIYNYFKTNQGKSLITDDSSIDYGLSYLFARYLQIRFGDGYIKKLYASQYTGIQAIEEVTNMDFNELFLDFIKMIFVTGRGVTTDTRYNIAEFNYTEGTEDYNRNGFNLASLIDTAYSSSYNLIDNPFFSSTSYSKVLEMYGFQITKWTESYDNVTLSSSGGIAGMYQAW